MGQPQKCLADQMYDEKEKHPGQRKNTSATGVGGSLTPYCVDGATLYCTMGSASSLLRVEDHGLRLTDRAAAHDGDTAPNKNIFPFGSCKLKDNKPCACPAPVGRWLLPDEYAIIGSCYAGKNELFQKAGILMQQARQAFEPLNASVFLLENAKMPQVEPWLRNALYDAVRSLREEKERIALMSSRTFADAAEAADYLGELHRSSKRMQEAATLLKNRLSGLDAVKEELQSHLMRLSQAQKGAMSSSLLEHLSRDMKADVIGGLQGGDKALYQQVIAKFADQAESLATTLQNLTQEGKATIEPVSADLGYQITMNSIIPCQVGGLIHF